MISGGINFFGTKKKSGFPSCMINLIFHIACYDLISPFSYFILLNFVFLLQPFSFSFSFFVCLIGLGFLRLELRFEFFDGRTTCKKNH
ncbi:hypothetical protein CROQUDRAFT_591663 [Cronartium quercuum f. sp. fusiforme G11]|uniref:Uncharacterized protein n=1 Tax=Cronartium quercuum f. sp. fusiforme G11 TaxID=708437 RepID=A0A9P6NIY7_9BASI|nr:hypothetical protein CROQUDRAFT_591663 [Cronartium quercuum f. sp. fusiforme G11]